jgi:hypothetical protein
VQVHQASGQPTGVLRGQVFDSGTGKPVESAKITYGRSSATTGADGSYTLAPVPEGTVVAQVRKPGTLTQLAVGTVADGKGDAVGWLGDARRGWMCHLSRYYAGRCG